MLIVGEKINTSIKDVKEAILQRNEPFIENLAKNQKLGGADYLEVNSGLRVYPEEEASDLEWLVPLVQKATGLSLCIDTAHVLVLEKALKLHQGKAIVNSINGDSERWGDILPLANAYGCDIIALPSDRKGIPPNVEGRIKIAERIIEGVAKEGIAQNRLYFDPLVLPLSSNTKNGLLFIDTLKEIKRVFPEAKTISGLSNISFGLPKRSWINQSFLVLSLGAGLDAAILNPLDKNLMALVRSTEAFLNKDTFCVKYIEAFRSGKLG
ncbi:MAG TPA: dihydropteroate synthase [Thermodesulfobacteriota bacterium]|nr:dihydropteroate synthase [Thermodesulfobacteriota bacterium]